MRKASIYIIAILLACGLPACKPTENNYRLAYDKAKQREREGLTEDEFEKMTLEGLPGYRYTATDSVRVFSKGVIWQYTPESVDAGNTISPDYYNLAVGKYTMLTNAKAHADRLAADGWRALVLRSGEPEYYVIVKQSSDLDTIAAAAHSYTKRYPQGTVSLHEPMAIHPLR